MTVFLTPDGRAVLRRHLLPAEPRHGCRFARCSRRSPPPGATGATRCWAAAGRASVERDRRRAGRRRPDAPPLRRRPCSTPARTRAAPASTTPAAAASAARPKFPPPMSLLFLLRHHQRTGDPRALAMVRAARSRRWPGAASTTSSAAASPATRSTRDWRVPHFEKMLYDNALLLRVYTQLWRLTGDPLAQRVAGETAAFLAGRARHRGRRASPPPWTPTPTGCEGAHLRLDAGPARRGARRRRRPLRRRPVHRHRGRHLRARHQRARLGRDVDDVEPEVRRPLAARTHRAAGRPGPPSAAGPGRQGGGRLERAGDHRPGRGRRRRDRTTR